MVKLFILCFYVVGFKKVGFIHPRNVFVSESFDNVDENVVSVKDDSSEHSRISDDESSICGPYSPILSDVTDCANSDDDLNEFDYDEMVPTEADDVLFPIPPTEVENTIVTSWPGFKLVIDNVDKNIRPSFQRIDRQTQSLHYCHTIAVKDRIDLSEYSEVSCNNLVTFSDFLPNAQDLRLIKRNRSLCIG